MNHSVTVTTCQKISIPCIECKGLHFWLLICFAKAGSRKDKAFGRCLTFQVNYVSTFARSTSDDLLGFLKDGLRM